MLQQLTLTHFRHVDSARWSDLAPVNILLGQNGAGKTNIMEAISLLSPGKGLRGGNPEQWRRQQNGPNAVWAINGLLQDDIDAISLATGSPQSNPTSSKRIVSINQVPQSTQQILADYLAIVWLTPQMDGLFLADSSERRRFFDRLIYALYPDHAKYLGRYDHALRQRNKLLKDRQRDVFWYKALHQTMAGPAVAIAAARLDTLAQFNGWIDQTDLNMPLPLLSVKGPVEELLLQHSASQVEQMLIDLWQQALTDDLQSGSTSLGPHRSDFSALYRAKNIDASFCSTGEQKSLLLSLILAHAHGVRQQVPGRPLIVLLDDIAAHFDEERRGQLYDFLPATGAQIFLSGTDKNDFDGIIGNAKVIQIQ
ncbi:MAG TPA: DNA replication/repair protein RecF [Alphaproteobacteria bacterium]